MVPHSQRSAKGVLFCLSIPARDSGQGLEVHVERASRACASSRVIGMASETPQDQNWASIIGPPASHRDPGIAQAESSCPQRSPLLARDLECSAGHGGGPPFSGRMGGPTCLVKVCWPRFLLGGTSFKSSGFILLGLLLDPSFCSHLFRLR